MASTTLIRNALIVIGDGSTPAFSGDVLLEDDRIAVLGDVPHGAQKTANQVIDAQGKLLCPGFTDTHNHGALGGTALGQHGVPMACELALRAGVTRRICGVDGLSPAPVLPHQRAAYAAQLAPLDGSVDDWNWSTVSEFYAWSKGRSVTDLGVYLGHSTVRLAVMGNAARLPDADELRQMQALVRKEAPHTLGFSTGLVYNPAVYSDAAELTALLRAFGEVAPAALFPHLRSESDLILPSLQECLSACVDAGAAYCNEHSKIAGKKNYGKYGALEDALRDGSGSVATMANMYPYTAGSTTGDAIFPPEIRAGTREAFLARLQDPATRRAAHRKMVEDTTSWDNFIAFCGGLEGIQIAGCKADEQFLGKRLGDVARAAGAADLTSPAAFEAVFDFFVRNQLQVTIISHYGSELIMEQFFRRDDMAICTDGLMPAPGAKPHPRSLGAFPKAIRLAREMGIGPERMINRMATLPSEFLGLTSPVLVPGADASLVLLDWNNVRECNSYEDPLVLPEGIHKVWVHGQLVMDEGSFPSLGVFPGRILKREMKASV